MDDLILHIEFVDIAMPGSYTCAIPDSTHISIVLFLYATKNVENIP